MIISGPRIALALIMILLGAPLLLGCCGWSRAGVHPARSAPWRVTWLSLALYVLAFNLTFFLQELCLVLPKLFIPGAHPILFHNDHSWHGANPLAELFEGTGALAILLSGIGFAYLAKRGAGRSEASRMFILWMAYSGLFMGLAQWAFGPFLPGSDTGRALSYLGFSSRSKTVLGIGAGAAIAGAGVFMGRRFLELGIDHSSAPPGGVGSRGFAFRVATLPAVLAIPVIVLFRIPREWSEVLIPPVAVAFIGTSWVQGASSWLPPVPPIPARRSTHLWIGAALVGAQLAIFQLVLRPGIHF